MWATHLRTKPCTIAIQGKRRRLPGRSKRTWAIYYRHHLSDYFWQRSRWASLKQWRIRRPWRALIIILYAKRFSVWVASCLWVCWVFTFSFVKITQGSVHGSSKHNENCVVACCSYSKYLVCMAYLVLLLRTVLHLECIDFEKWGISNSVYHTS